VSTTSMATDERKPINSRRVAVRKQPFARSRVGNGKALLAGIDQRTLPYREYCDVVSDLASHMGGEPTAVEAAISEEAAGLIVWCRQAKLALLRGDDFDVAVYCTATNALRRLLADIGQQRRMRELVPTVSGALEAKSL
jgi:hypothetical protein